VDPDRITWQFIEERLPRIPWCAVLVGIRDDWCDWRVAVGRTAADDRRLGKRPAPKDREEALSQAQALCRDHGAIQQDVDRIWQYLAVAWITEGHGEPGSRPIDRAESRDQMVDSVWATLGYRPELSFVSPVGRYMFEPGEPYPDLPQRGGALRALHARLGLPRARFRRHIDEGCNPLENWERQRIEDAGVPQVHDWWAHILPDVRSWLESEQAALDQLC
jgi:hypothetical protein